MKKHLLIVSMFIIVANGRLAAQYVYGIDVSHYQGAINWTQVSAAGKVFAFVKATEGVTYTDPNFFTNMTNGTSAGVMMGAYHLARPDNNPNAVLEANNFLNIAYPLYIGGACQLPPALDIEDPFASNYGNPAALSIWIQQWITAVMAGDGGVAPVIYTTGYYAANLNSSLHTYGLWIADPGASPPPTNIGTWPTWGFMQNSWTGVVLGISGSVDLDIFNGTITDLNSLTNCNPGCTNYLSTPFSASYSLNSSNGTFTVSAIGTNCTYSVMSNCNWVNNVVAGNNGIVTYNVDANNTCNNRTCTISVFDGGGLLQPSATYTITQASLTPPNTPGPITGNSSICFGQPYNYFVPLVTGATSYNWTDIVGNGANLPHTTTSPNENVTWTNNGPTSDIICVTASNICGTSAPSCTNPISLNSPISNLSASATPNPSCVGNTIYFNVSATGTITLWSWNGPNGFNSTSFSPFINNIQPNQAGNYTLTATNFCGSTSTSVNVTVNPLPNPVITFLNTCTFQTTQSYNQYLWFMNGSPAPGNNNNSTYSPNPVPAGTYFTVQVTDANGCTGTSTVQFYGCTVGINETSSLKNLFVYPNPTDELLNIQGDNLSNGNFEITLTNTLGQQLKKQSLKISNHSIGIKMSIKELSSGIYFLNITSDQEKQIFKVQKL